jgi:hypothetical protein
MLLVLITAGLLGGVICAAEPPHPPILSSQQVTPYNLNDRARFQFQVHYTSPDHNPPKTIQVVVDGQEITLRTTSHRRYDAIYTSRPAKFEVGMHKYYFTCEDTKGMTDRSPRYGEWTGPYVARSWQKFYNNYPELADGQVVQGEVGDEETPFTYSVHYSDYDSTPAKEVSVVIDGLTHPMQLVRGKLRNGFFSYNTYLDTGAHGYYFVAEDRDGAQVTYPPEGFLHGPSVGEVPLSNPELTDATVDPLIDVASRVFAFRVRYLDEDRDPPLIMQVYVDGVPHNMTLWQGKEYDGVYVYQTKLPESKFHTYYYRAEDGRGGEVSVPMMGVIHGPVVVNQ